MSAILCEHCLADSGVTNANRRCCIVRGIANGPKDRRKARYEAVLKTEGKEAANQLIAEVNAETKRLFELRHAGVATARAKIKDLLS